MDVYDFTDSEDFDGFNEDDMQNAQMHADTQNFDSDMSSDSRFSSNELSEDEGSFEHYKENPRDGLIK